MKIKKERELIEYHALSIFLIIDAYRFLVVLLDFLKISILHIISMLSSIILLTGTAIHIRPRLCVTLLCTTLSIHFSTCSLESSIDFCHSSINSSQILSLMSIFQFLQSSFNRSLLVSRQLVT